MHKLRYDEPADSKMQLVIASLHQLQFYVGECRGVGSLLLQSCDPQHSDRFLAYMQMQASHLNSMVASVTVHDRQQPGSGMLDPKGPQRQAVARHLRSVLLPRATPPSSAPPLVSVRASQSRAKLYNPQYCQLTNNGASHCFSVTVCVSHLPLHALVNLLFAMRL